jgi:hypothetical protein
MESDFLSAIRPRLFGVGEFFLPNFKYKYFSPEA